MKLGGEIGAAGALHDGKRCLRQAIDENPYREPLQHDRTVLREFRSQPKPQAIVGEHYHHEDHGK